MLDGEVRVVPLGKRGPPAALALLELHVAIDIGHAVIVMHQPLRHLHPLVGQVLVALGGLDQRPGAAVGGVVRKDRGAGTAGARRVLRPDAFP